MSSVIEVNKLLKMMESPGPVVRCETCDYVTPEDCPAQYVIKVLELHSIGAHGSPPLSVRCTSCDYVTRPDCPSVRGSVRGKILKTCVYPLSDYCWGIFQLM